jgi:membrane associated rhomboid family serine protease
MGIYNRDYFRDEQRRFRPGGMASAYKWLIAANVVIYLLQIFVQTTELVPVDEMHVVRVHDQIVTSALDLSPHAVLHGQVWRLLTYAFCHSVGSVWHILFNMLFLVWFGATLERMYGTREFLLFYLAAAIVSGVAFLALAFALGDPTPAVGASGAVMAIMALYAVHFPREEIFLFGLIRIQIRYFVLFYLVYDLYPVLTALSGTGHSDGVAHAAHLGGLAFGFAYHHFGFRFDRNWDVFKRLRAPRIRMRKPPESVRLYDPSAPDFTPRSENLEKKVDAILAKIQAHGEASLSEQERETLRMASRQYKENMRNR